MVDRGGTFTDIVARDPNGKLHTRKLLSENSQYYRDAALYGIRQLLDLPAQTPIPKNLVHSIKMGTTIATNALLERKGTPTVLVITQGFKDAIRIGYQNRPQLFDLNIRLPEMLYSQVVEVTERVTATGKIDKPLHEEALRKQLEDVHRSGIESAAIVLMHGYKYPAHEKKVASIAKEIGFRQISVSHEVSPLIKLVARGDTTLMDAYLSPILRRYVEFFQSNLTSIPLYFMQSNGGLVEANQFHGKDSILSGPAGGVVGAVKVCAAAGHHKIIGFDMGGTSTDVSHYAGTFERTLNSVVSETRIRAPMMRIHTVAAGGGSIVKFDGQRLRVGPESAGASPGPASYRQNGPLTVTDCNLLLGRIIPAHFPHVFGSTGDLPLDVDIVKRQFKTLHSEFDSAGQSIASAEHLAEGILKIAVESMASAIKKISTQRGYDVQEYVLCSFGGAGGQHACAVGDALGIKTILIHPLAGVLSAYGMALAELRAIRSASIETLLNTESILSANRLLKELQTEAVSELQQLPITIKPTLICSARIKYQGADSAIEVPWSDLKAMTQGFVNKHQQYYGYHSNHPLELESVSVEALADLDGLEQSNADIAINQIELVGEPQVKTTTTRIFIQGSFQEASIFDRAQLLKNRSIPGPALIIEPNSTTLVEPGWSAQVLESNNLELRRTTPLSFRSAPGTAVDPVMLEIFNNRFMAIAEQMGAVLEKTSRSVNIKERLDFSCALFNSAGDLIANAPHIPVHLGSMGECVKTVISRFKDTITQGDVFISNAPYEGGTHLPDITVISPVFNNSGTAILFFLASRGHHADIGGITPGSMPAQSTHIDQEGVLFDYMHLVKSGNFLEDDILAHLTESPFPARNPNQNIADLKAQVAANKTGINEMRRLIHEYGESTVTAYMQHVQNNAEECVRNVISTLEDGAFVYAVDDIAEIHVALRVDSNNRSLIVDFTGTTRQLSNNFNAPLAVCRAVVLYVFRTLVKADIPLNDGCLKPIEIIIPEDCMLNPRRPAAIVAGNVETSQWIANALYGALGVNAAAQGTMNNFTFGNDKYQYYETIGGGSGAGVDYDGASAVQTHMTNSRLTDPEVLEARFPVLVEHFTIRSDSGGIGQFRGGDGVSRQIRFLEPMEASILSSHRSTRPFGLHGGRSGEIGKNQLIRYQKEPETLPGVASIMVFENDAIKIQTPGGGGFGDIQDEY